MPKRQEVILVVCVLVLGLALRLAFALLHSDLDIAFDQKFYYRQAVALAEEGSLPQDYVVRPPIYMAFLAVVIKTFGPEVNTLRVTQTVLSIIPLFIFYLLARRLLGVIPGLVATALLVVYPASIIGPWLLLTEFIFTPLVLLAMWFVIKALEEPNRRRWLLLGGAFWALAALTRAAAAGYFVLALAALLLASRRTRISRRTIVLAAVTFLIVLSPWTIRNYTRYGGFMFIDNTASFNLWLTNTPEIPIREFSQNHWQKIENQIERQRVGMREGLRAIRSDPAYYVKRCGRRFSKFWSWGDLYPTLDPRRRPAGQSAGGFRRLLAGMSGPAFWIVLVPALVGLGLSVRKRKYLLLSGFVIYLTLVHSLLVANARHRSPLTPLLIILAVFAVSEVVRWIRTVRRSEAALR